MFVPTGLPVFEMLEARQLLSGDITGALPAFLDGGDVTGGVAYTSTVSFSSNSSGTYPLKVTQSGSTLTVDMSALPAGTNIYRCIFRTGNPGNTAYFKVEAGCTTPVQVQASDRPGAWYSLMAPRYMDFDVTDAAQRAMLTTDRKLRIDIVSFGNFSISNGVRFDVTCDRPSLNPNLQALTGIAIKNRNGDTMVNWHEAGEFLNQTSATVAQYNAAVSTAKATGITYRIYRSHTPIDAVSIRSAELVDEVGSLTAWDIGFYNGTQSDTSVVPRYPVDDLVLAAPDQGIYVRRDSIADSGVYYAVTEVINGEENLSNFTAGQNTTAAPITEGLGQGMVLLREQQLNTSFTFVDHANMYYYVRWEAEPFYNVPDTALDYLVGVPSGTMASRPVTIDLHCWGGSLTGGYGWWFEAENGAILLATNQTPYDWWTASSPAYGTARPFTNVQGYAGPVKNYQQDRIMSFLDDFVATHYSIDQNRLLLAGASMGGSGAIMWGLRNAARFANANAWVGVSIPRECSYFKSSFEQCYGYDSWNLPYEDTGMSTFDYWDTNRFLRANPAQETPYISFANGKNDGSIGWNETWKTVNALIDTRQPFEFEWTQNGHNTRSHLPGGGERDSIIAIRKNQTVPAFTHCTLDNVMGDGTDTNGDPTGQINGYSMWNPDTSIDTATTWAEDIYLLSAAPQSTSRVDVTPRRCQQFKPAPGSAVSWTNKDLVTGQVVASGTVIADQYGLVTIPQTVMSKNRNRITMTITSAPLMGDADYNGKVDVVDLGVLAKNYDSTGLPHGSGQSYRLADFNDDGKVDVIDLGVLAKNYDMSILGGAMTQASQPGQVLAVSLGAAPAAVLTAAPLSSSGNTQINLLAAQQPAANTTPAAATATGKWHFRAALGSRYDRLARGAKTALDLDILHLPPAI